jgi:HAD superfamily hydrolase (TIGR01509 family)
MLQACLIDVYDTILSCDFTVLRHELPKLAGVDPAVWHDTYSRIAPAGSVGQVSRADGFEIALRACGLEPRDELVRALVARDRELLLANSRLYADSLPFLERVRSRGIKVVIVSNCGQTTRYMLTMLGVPAIADSLVLSCEVGLIKPSARIFQLALERAGVAAGDALFIDDQAAFCAGAEMAGIRAVRIVRDGDVPAGAIRSLTEAEPLLG